MMVLRRLTPPSVLAALWRFYRRTEQAELGLISAGVAFFAFLSLFPAAAAVLALWGLVFDPEVIRSQMALLGDLLPSEAALLVERQIEALLRATGGSLGWATVLSTAFAIWSARAGAAAMIRGLNAIHHLPNRAGHRHQLSALVLTLVLVALALAAMLMAVVLPLGSRLLPPALVLRVDLVLANEVTGLALVILATALAYRFGPNFGARRRPPPLSVGLVVAVALWGIATRGFVLYLENFPAYNQIYGSIGAVVALLVWLYVSAYAVLLGAAIDAERLRPPRQ